MKNFLTGLCVLTLSPIFILISLIYMIYDIGVDAKDLLVNRNI